jgi:hypothetical protein
MALRSSSVAPLLRVDPFFSASSVPGPAKAGHHVLTTLKT